MLTQADKKYWAPNLKVLDWLKAKYAGQKVLDVGPGHAPLSWATQAVDFVEVAGLKCPFTKVNLAEKPLPFPDKSFDFIYCRHMLEDMYDPFPVIREISRVGKAGYIEMPSPMAEIGRGVDGGSPPYRGYHHHRFIGWVGGDELRLISKYPLIEYLRFDEERIDALLRLGPNYWNTYYLWEGSIKVFHRQNPLNLIFPGEYNVVLTDAMTKSKESTDLFFDSVK
jgi:hypothetical protein